MQDTFDAIDPACCDAYAALGAVCLCGVFDEWVDLLRDGVQRNHDEPGPYFSENVVDGDAGRFWDD
ncbi:MAG: phytanoyl-CoA dioxygenase, partial [Gammaproteobacteria bacterium]|nr:phytanoyl-CoA dioxygenase [Gammaproteobacteria bacterium]